MNELFPFADYQFWIGLWTISGFLSMLLFDMLVEEFTIERQIYLGLPRDKTAELFNLKRLFWAFILGSFGGIFLIVLVLVAAVSLLIQGDRVYRGFRHDIR